MSNTTAPIYNEPSDQQLAQLLGGTKVVSFRPEDLIHFLPDSRHELAPWQAHQRLMDLFNRVKGHYPAYDQPPKALSILSTTRSAAVHTLSTETRYNIGSPYETCETETRLFVLMRPSLKIDSALSLANESRIDPALIVNPVDRNTLHRLATWHEFGHMRAHANNIDIRNQYDSEIIADYMALQRVSEESGDHVIRPYILSRALAGFFRQPPHYWLAPQLTRLFTDKAKNEAPATITIDIELQDRVWASYAELRLRTTADVGLNDKLDTHSSQELQTALTLWNAKQDDRIADMRLRQYCQIFDKVRNDNGFYERTGDILQDLARITALPHLDPLTRECGKQILEAGRMYCPRITPRI